MAHVAQMLTQEPIYKPSSIFCFKPILLSAHKLTMLIYGDNTWPASPLLSGARACWAFWAPLAIASWSLAASATMSMTGRGCGAVCGVARAPVLRALVDASGAASLVMAPELVTREEA